MSCPIPDSESEYSLEVDLSHEINPNQCTHVVMSTKIEINLKKIQGLRWDTLERKADQPLVDDVKPIPQGISKQCSLLCFLCIYFKLF